jgi:hypothetical protein
MLLTITDIVKKKQPEEPEAQTPPVLRLKSPRCKKVSNPESTLQEEIGQISHDECIHFWSFGSYSLHELMFYLLKQTGPAHVNLCTWSISQDAIEKITRKYRGGEILSIRFLLDPRVKVCKAKPLQMITSNFRHAITRVHAKVVTIENNEWKISIVSSQNATNNPKLERGVIIISDEIHDFDKQIIDNEFRKHEVRNDRATGGTILHPEGDRHHTGS